MSETVMLLVVLSAAREHFMVVRTLGSSSDFGRHYSYVWGFAVWGLKEPDWLPGLWEAR